MLDGRRNRFILFSGNDGDEVLLLLLRRGFFGLDDELLSLLELRRLFWVGKRWE